VAISQQAADPHHRQPRILRLEWSRTQAADTRSRLATSTGINKNSPLAGTGLTMRFSLSRRGVYSASSSAASTI